jgi:lysophospholipid acyltransferase (LPLAT)-like uncharacterized protein
VGWRRLALWPVGLLATVWMRTLRFEFPPGEQARFETQDQPVAFILWHNRLFPTAELHRRYRRGRPLHALISASRDGAWLAAFFALMGIHAVRGSSSRLGREALTGLVDVLRRGDDVGITPDGPRGPCYDFKPGALIAVRRTACLPLLVGVEFSSAWRLGSWDKFYLPRPFSRLRVRCVAAAGDLDADRDAAARAVAEQLRLLNPDAPNRP